MNAVPSGTQAAYPHKLNFRVDNKFVVELNSSFLCED